MTKLAWDNAAYISIDTARKLGVENCDLLNITVGGRNLVAPVWIAPGQADDTVSLEPRLRPPQARRRRQRRGRRRLQPAVGANPWFVTGAEVVKFGGRRMVYSTQDHGSLDPGIDPASPKDDSVGLNPGRGYPVRPIVRETTVDGFKKDPDFSQKGDLIAKENLRSLWDHNVHPDLGPPALVGAQQWGMVIDLNSAPVAPRARSLARPRTTSRSSAASQVANGREMHWIRLDRYYTGPRRTPGHRPADAVPALRDRPLRERVPGPGHVAQPRGPQRHGLQPLHRHPLLREQLPVQGPALQLLQLQQGPATTTSSSACRRTRTSRSASAASSRSAPTACSASRRPRSRPTGAGEGMSRTARSSPPASRSARADAIVFGDLADPRARRV
jgi:hypothetical protein